MTVDADARFNQPTGIAVDVEGYLYVADFSNHTVRKITRQGVVTTIAGLAGSSGSVNGIGSAALFKQPNGVAVDGQGTVYVSDYGNHTIRKISREGVVSTLAGVAGSRGSTDGVAGVARLFNPSGIAVDNAGNVYVSDESNHTVRRITQDGVVSTLAGFPGSGGASDGPGSTARFSYPRGLAVDGAGSLYVADSDNSVIRKITAAGVVSTVAGLSKTTGGADGSGSVVRFKSPGGVALDSAGNVYVADIGGCTLRTTRPLAKADQFISFPLLPDRLLGDAPFAVNATASSGLAVTFSIIDGPATFEGNLVTLTGAGVVTVRASQVGDAYFNATSMDRSFHVSKLQQSISFGALSKQVVGDAPFALAASASSGLSIRFSVLSGPVVLSGNFVTMTGTGLAIIRASQDGDAIYAPAPNVDQVLIIVPGSNVISDLQQLPNGMFTLRFYGDSEADYVLKGSTNLVDWEPLVTNQVNGLGFLEFTDTFSTNYDRRFYMIAP